MYNMADGSVLLLILFRNNIIMKPLTVTCNTEKLSLLLDLSCEK
jgi:hypothetical protein